MAQRRSLKVIEGIQQVQEGRIMNSKCIHNMSFINVQLHHKFQICIPFGLDAMEQRLIFKVIEGIQQVQEGHIWGPLLLQNVAYASS